ncbi:MAG TPA: isoleucine--tRNA ligase [Acidimicrobiales bacterium]|nr:isoleucine--tRNA ligase [Acidimicrobiales bacterium]
MASSSRSPGSGSPPGRPSPYPRVPDRPDFDEIERDVLKYWADDGTFEASVKARSGAKEYVFYDGPPFANGLPHYGHLLTGYVKDAIPRYKTMQGWRVERRFGWDCHGLPAEMEAVKELELPTRLDIEQYGVGRFNEYCQASVLRYTSEWERYVTRQARWVDFSNDYKTMDLSYMESVMWAFSQLHKKGLLYEGYRVLPYCWQCETPLSNFETRQDNSYRPRQDPAITVRFELTRPPEGHPASALFDAGLPVEVLVWTTTPWTLPSNLALAVGPDIRYAVLKSGNSLYLVADARSEPVSAAVETTLPNIEKVSSIDGSDLLGLQYRPLFDFFQDEPGAFRVLAGDFVSTEEGTGIVHIAPGFGEDDQRVAAEAGIAVVCPVDSRGRFTVEVPPYAGTLVFDANPAVIADLKQKGALVSHETYEHSYPHCWRTDNPLIYKAVSSWFVKVTAIKERMLQLNQEINWVPAHVRDGAFGKWLEGARDWSISRNRFWGAPVPVWKSDDPRWPRVDVYGSLDQLAADFGVRPTDLHRPAIDDLARPNPDDPTGTSMMRRVEDVLDCWFESGSMPFAQVHYPFEDAEWFEGHFPADFIVEYVGQTRGWFYTLHVLATALFDKPPFQNCLAHGIVLGDDKQKLSKRLRNYPDPDEMFRAYGSDAMRWFLISSPVMRGGDLVVERKGPAEAVRAVLNPLWNAWKFFALYANADGYEAKWGEGTTDVLDRYVLSKARLLVEDVTVSLDTYDLYGACTAVTNFLDALNNWYIRRSRDRFWSRMGTSQSSDESKVAAYDTLFMVLHTLCLVTAPLLPMLSETVYRGLTGERSVHLADWPTASALPRDAELVGAMDTVRAVCSAGHSVRKARDLRARLPLQSVTVAGAGAPALEPYADLIADELNVKQVLLVDDVSEVADLVLRVDPSVIGPRFGAATQQVISAVRRGEWARTAHGVQVAGRVLAADEYFMSLMPKDPDAGRALPGNELVVSLALGVTPELAREGLARDVVRQVQEARKRAGLDVSDHIRLALDFSHHPALREAVEEHLQIVAGETLADEVVFTDGAISDGVTATVSDGLGFDIGLVKLPQP